MVENSVYGKKCTGAIESWNDMSRRRRRRQEEDVDEGNEQGAEPKVQSEGNELK
jgi:hypothetical protein